MNKENDERIRRKSIEATTDTEARKEFDEYIQRSKAEVKKKTLDGLQAGRNPE